MEVFLVVVFFHKLFMFIYFLLSQDILANQFMSSREQDPSASNLFFHCKPEFSLQMYAEN